MSKVISDKAANEILELSSSIQRNVDLIESGMTATIKGLPRLEKIKESARRIEQLLKGD